MQFSSSFVLFAAIVTSAIHTTVVVSAERTSFEVLQGVSPDSKVFMDAWTNVLKQKAMTKPVKFAKFGPDPATDLEWAIWDRYFKEDGVPTLRHDA
ncbi:hypothetical protein BC835DRAFT_1315663 [Cytidiella melzeri]|nr:hypothetical protein BC835DRAFT_1315663 [Cytidiella melzeri]